MSDTTTTCRCGRPTRDSAYVCDPCASELSRALGDVPWLEEQMEITITRAKGVDYRTKGATRASERPSPVVWGAAEARGHLKAVLVSWALFSLQESVRNQSPSQAAPEDTLTSISRYLMWRVDGLTLLDIGPEAVDEITDAVAKCNRLIDRPADRQYLGQCEACVTGRLYARPGSTMARCEACDASVDAVELKDKLLVALDDRLCTPSEIAKLSTYLGLRKDRDAVRKTIEHWGRKGRLERHPALTDQAVYRFGDAYQMLTADEYAGRKSA